MVTGHMYWSNGFEKIKRKKVIESKKERKLNYKNVNKTYTFVRRHTLLVPISAYSRTMTEEKKKKKKETERKETEREKERGKKKKCIYDC